MSPVAVLLRSYFKNVAFSGLVSMASCFDGFLRMKRVILFIFLFLSHFYTPSSSRVEMVDDN